MIRPVPQLPVPLYAVLFVLCVSLVSVWAIVRMQSPSPANLLPIIWPAGGITLGFMFLASVIQKSPGGAYVYLAAAWVGVLLGAVLSAPEFVGMALALGTVRCLEVWASWRVLRGGVARHANNLGHPDVLLKFSVVAMWSFPFASAVLVTLYMSHTFPGLDVVPFFMGWWISSGLGVAVFTPMVASFAPKKWGGPDARAPWRSLAVPWATLATVCLLVFVQDVYPFSFMCFVPLMWLVFRGGFPGAALGSMTLVVICLPLTIAGYGPVANFLGSDTYQSVLVLQVYIATGLLLVFPVGMILDHRERLIARIKKREEELLYASLHDPLTSLLNRRGFDVHMQEELDRARNNKGTVSAVVIDVDHFKAYNDTYGHDQGDECLIWIAKTIQQQAHMVSGIASRQGGEEFGVLLPQMTIQQATSWADTLRSHIDQAARPHAGSSMGHLTVSIGAAARSATGRATDTKTLLQDADRALYEAKNTGRNRVCAQKADRPVP